MCLHLTTFEVESFYRSLQKSNWRSSKTGNRLFCAYHWYVNNVFYFWSRRKIEWSWRLWREFSQTFLWSRVQLEQDALVFGEGGKYFIAVLNSGAGLSCEGLAFAQQIWVQWLIIGWACVDAIHSRTWYHSLTICDLNEMLSLIKRYKWLLSKACQLGNSSCCLSFAWSSSSSVACIAESAPNNESAFSFLINIKANKMQPHLCRQRYYSWWPIARLWWVGEQGNEKLQLDVLFFSFLSSELF